MNIITNNDDIIKYLDNSLTKEKINKVVNPFLGSHISLMPKRYQNIHYTFVKDLSDYIYNRRIPGPYLQMTYADKAKEQAIKNYIRANKNHVKNNACYLLAYTLTQITNQNTLALAIFLIQKNVHLPKTKKISDSIKTHIEALDFKQFQQEDVCELMNYLASQNIVLKENITLTKEVS